MGQGEGLGRQPLCLGSGKRFITDDLGLTTRQKVHGWREKIGKRGFPLFQGLPPTPMKISSAGATWGSALQSRSASCLLLMGFSLMIFIGDGEWDFSLGIVDDDIYHIAWSPPGGRQEAGKKGKGDRSRGEEVREKSGKNSSPKTPRRENEPEVKSKRQKGKGLSPINKYPNGADQICCLSFRRIWAQDVSCEVVSGRWGEAMGVVRILLQVRASWG